MTFLQIGRDTASLAGRSRWRKTIRMFLVAAPLVGSGVRSLAEAEVMTSQHRPRLRWHPHDIYFEDHLKARNRQLSGRGMQLRSGM
jgi:hypothetical protein